MSEASSEASPLVIERLLSAPVALVWSLWTEPEHFKAWYGPSGATIPIAHLDVRVGGSRLVTMEMSTPNGPMRMSFAGEYVEVVENSRLVYTEYMADESGAPMPNGPQVTRVFVELQALGDQTRVTLTHVGIPPDSPGAIGWNMALDNLAKYAVTVAG